MALLAFSVAFPELGFALDYFVHNSKPFFMIYFISLGLRYGICHTVVSVEYEGLVLMRSQDVSYWPLAPKSVLYKEVPSRGIWMVSGSGGAKPLGRLGSPGQTHPLFGPM